jgi:tetratricopeptide (TPR) repeat protein
VSRGVARWTAALAVVVALVLPAGADGVAHGQGVPVLRELAVPTQPCAAATPGVVTPESRAAAQRLRDEADASTLAGDAVGARERLRRAAVLDPADPELAYRLGRAHEELGDAAAARLEYCRFQTLARSSEDAAEARARLTALGAAPPATSADPIVVRFRAGLARAAVGDLAGAEREFTTVLDRWPHHPAPLLNRAAVRVARGSAGPALEDLDRYVAAVPAPLPPALAARDVLRNGRRDPGTVLAMGVVPGGAQLATGRPAAAALVAAVAIAGVALALNSESVLEERRFTDPFGNPYTEMVAVQGHPRRTLGLSLSTAAIVGGAIEGFLRASGARRRTEELRQQTLTQLRSATVGSSAGH